MTPELLRTAQRLQEAATRFRACLFNEGRELDLGDGAKMFALSPPGTHLFQNYSQVLFTFGATLADAPKASTFLKEIFGTVTVEPVSASMVLFFCHGCVDENGGITSQRQHFLAA